MKKETGNKNIFPLVVRLIIAALVLVISSCGGGGGGAPPDVTLPDTTLPTVVGTSPAAGATGVAVNSALSIAFSEAIDLATLTPAAIRLVAADSTPIPGTISYSGLSVVFTPSSPLAFSSSFTLVVSTAVKDLVGNPLAVEYSCTFVTAAPSPPPAGPAPPPDPVAVSVNGLVVVSWGAVSGATSYNVYLASRPGVTKDNYHNLPDGTQQPVYNETHTFSGLINGKTYYFVVTGKDPYGVEGGESVEVSATPQMGATGPYTGDARNIKDTSVHLVGNFTNPPNATTSVWFEYGTTTAYGSATVPEVYAAAGQIYVSVDLSGLSERTVFHYRLVTQNSAGLFVGQDRTVKTYATPQVLLNNLDSPTGLVGLVSDGTFLYWQEIYAGRVRRFNKGSGSVELVASTPFEGNSGSISIDQTHIYWADSNTIWRAELNGANLTTFSDNVLSDISFLKICSNGLLVKHNHAPPDNLIASISLISLDGSTITPLFDRIPLYSEGFGGDVELDAGYLYWSDSSKGIIQKMPVSGGAVTTLAVGLAHPYDLLLDGNTLYVTVSGAIKKLSTSGGVVEEVAAVGNYHSEINTNMAKDGTNLYVATGTTVLWPEETISRIDLTTGAVTPLVAGQNTTGALIVDASNIYWLNEGSQYYYMGSLNRISKF